MILSVGFLIGNAARARHWRCRITVFVRGTSGGQFGIPWSFPCYVSTPKTFITQYYLSLDCDPHIFVGGTVKHRQPFLYLFIDRRETKTRKPQRPIKNKVIKELIELELKNYDFKSRRGSQSNFRSSVESSPILLWYCFTSVCDWSRKLSIPCISLVLTAAHILGAGTV